jgi:hypothetical protein
MTDTFFIKRGDTAPAIRFALEPVATVLTGATVRFLMRVRGGAQVAEGLAQIVTATGTPTVQYNWTAADTVEAGQFEAEFEVTYPDGAIETFPNAGFIPVRVGEDVR